jgi:hypothetical protein
VSTRALQMLYRVGELAIWAAIGAAFSLVWW